MKQKKRAPNGVWTPESQHTYALRRITQADAENQPTLREFAKWLADSRDLRPETISDRIRSGCTFVDSLTARARCGCEQALRSITVQQIEDFFVEYGKDHGMGCRNKMRAAMRLVLMFAAGRSWVDRVLVDAVPSLGGYRLSGLPRGISDEQLQTLLTSPWEGGSCPRRDRAVVYLLATYGIRRQQVSALRLVDIDWHQRTIDFAAHKGGKAIHHILAQSVAQALADYLRHERPTSDSDYVFLRHPPPHLRLGPFAISTLVTSRMKRCGLPPRGPHALRHTFATRLLRAGESMKTIADLLGHRSLDAVAIYAKVDYARLLECAIDWPGVVS